MSENFSPFPGSVPGGPPPGGPPQGGPAPRSGPVGPGPLGPGPGHGPGPGMPSGGPAGGPGRASPVASPPPAVNKSRRDDKKEKKPTKRTISRNLLLTIIFAVVAGGLTLFILSDEDDFEYVIRALNDIPAGTAVSGSLLEAAPLTVEAIEPNAFKAPTAEEALELALEEIEGTVTQYPLPAKTQLRADQFGLQATLGQELEPNERLVSVRATVSTAVAGGLIPGDYVDIIGATDGHARVVAYNVPIMSVTASEERYDSVSDAQAADPDLRPGEVLPSDPVPGIYVVKVPVEVVPTLLNWNESATLNLAYRGADSISVPLPDSSLDDEELAYFDDIGEDEIDEDDDEEDVSDDE